jgi:hypothetical protein
MGFAELVMALLTDNARYGWIIANDAGRQLHPQMVSHIGFAHQR